MPVFNILKAESSKTICASRLLNRCNLFPHSINKMQKNVKRLPEQERILTGEHYSEERKNHFHQRSPG